MSTLEEVLSLMSDEDYLHDIQFIIDEDLRTVTIPKNGVVLGVVGDKNINRINFTIPKVYNGFNMNALEIRVNYTNAAGEKDYYIVEDKTVENNNLLFSWLVDSKVTSTVGNVDFTVSFLNIVDDEVQNMFNTTIASAKVLPGLNVEYSDINTIKYLRKSYSPNGDAWADTAHVNFTGGQAISAKITAFGPNDDENVLSIGTNNSISAFYNSATTLHLYSVKEGDTTSLNISLCGADDHAQDTIAVTLPLTIKLNKDGLYINNTLHTSEDKPDYYAELFADLVSKSTLLVGSMEGSTRSKAVYEYIKVDK